MKNLFSFVFCFVVVSGAGNAAGSGTTVPVNIVTDSPGTMAHQIKDLSELIKIVQHSLEEVQLATRTVENQIRMIQSLQEGDWDGLVRSFDYASESFHQFNKLLAGTDFFKEQKLLEQQLSSSKFTNFRERSRKMGKTVENASEAMWAADTLLKNTQSRIEEARRLQRLSQGEKSVTRQMQIFNQYIGLVQGELGDFQKALAAQNNFLVALEEEKKLKQQIADRQIEEFFSGEGFYDPIHSEEAYEDAIWGRRHRRIMDGENPDG